MGISSFVEVDSTVKELNKRINGAVDTSNEALRAVNNMSETVKENTSRINEVEKGMLGASLKLDNMKEQYCEIKSYTSQIPGLIVEVKNINKIVGELACENKEQNSKIESSDSDKTFGKKAKKLVDEVVKWAVLLVLGFVAVKLGLM